MKTLKKCIFILTILPFIIPSFAFIKHAYSTASTISGVVTDGEYGIPWARVRIQATSNYTSTDFQGRFTLEGVTSLDTLVVTAWAEGYYNGQTHALLGDTGVAIVLHPLFTEDNPDYQWISPVPDSTDDMRCGNCHTETLLNQWGNNAHANSAVNPFFLAMYYGTDIDGNPNVGVGYKLDFRNTFGNCATCHIPGAAANNPWGVDPSSTDEVNKNGVFCDVCHKIFRVLPTTGQGTTGTLSIEFRRPPEGMQMFFGPYDDIHEPDAYLPLIRQGEYCAPCHLGKFWNTAAYNCFTEWQESAYPSMGIECQTCHMAPDSVTTHFARPEVGGLERDPLTIPSHLQPGSRDSLILANSLTMNTAVHQIGDSIRVMVTITNDKTGHHVPTGRPSRNMILLIDAEGESGNDLEMIRGPVVPWWGGRGERENRDYEGYPGKGFAKILEDFEGNAPSPAWRPAHILSDNRIGAFRTDTSYYYFRAPPESQNITVNTRLIFRRFFKDWMNEKKFDIPDILMEEEKIDFSSTSVYHHAHEMPGTYWLGQNYPNPFNSMTSIQFALVKPQEVTLTLYNLGGQDIRILLHKNLNPGVHTFQFDLNDIPSGIYIYRIFMSDFSAKKKLILLK